MPRLKASPSTLTEATGHQMALAMLKQIGKHWNAREKGVPDEEIHDLWKREQSRVMRLHLKAVERLNNEAVTKGFYAVLTDILGWVAFDVGTELLKRYAK